MTDSAPSYEHPGITDPVSSERPRGTGPFAMPVPAAKQPSTESQTEVVDLATELTEAGIEDVLTELDNELVGLTPVKTRIREIAALLLVERVRRKLGLSSEPPTLHMSFTGNPGTGKTTVALRMADILHRLGFVRKGHLISVTRDDLVGQYIGHTGTTTQPTVRGRLCRATSPPPSNSPTSRMPAPSAMHWTALACVRRTASCAALPISRSPQKPS